MGLARAPTSKVSTLMCLHPCLWAAMLHCPWRTLQEECNLGWFSATLLFFFGHYCGWLRIHFAPSPRNPYTMIPLVSSSHTIHSIIVSFGHYLLTGLPCRVPLFLPFV